MTTIIKIATTDCDNIEIQLTTDIMLSEFISGYIADMGLLNDETKVDEQPNIVDLTTLGHHNLTAIQARRVYLIWNFLYGTEEGREYMERADIDYWQYRNFRLDDCLAEPLRDLLKTASNHEIETVKKDLVRSTTIPYEELTANEYTKEFLEKGYIGIGLTVDLIKYGNLLGIDPIIRILCGVLVGNLKSLVKVFPTKPVAIPASVPALAPDTGLLA